MEVGEIRERLDGVAAGLVGQDGGTRFYNERIVAKLFRGWLIAVSPLANAGPVELA